MAETIDQQFIEYIVKALVSKPDEVKITRTIDERGVLLELYVDQEDLGRVIGRAGGTAKSIRTLLRALGVKNDARYNLKIVDTNGGGRKDDQRSEAPAAAPVDDAVVATDDTPETDQPQAEVVEAPAEEAPAEEEDTMAKHRSDIDDLTSGLDI